MNKIKQLFKRFQKPKNDKRVLSEENREILITYFNNVHYYVPRDYQGELIKDNQQ